MFNFLYFIKIVLSLITNFLISNANHDSNINNEEHTLIASYCSRLADYYVKNPSAPLTPDTATQLISNDILYTHKHQLQPHTVSSLINSYNSNLRHNKKTNLKNKTNIEQNKVNRINDRRINNYWSNTSLNTQNQINGAKISTSNSNQKCVDFKMMQNKIRSLSENNFRQSDDEDDNEENQFIMNSKRLFDDELSKDLEDTLLNEKRELVVKLEQQNKEILKEIKKLKLKQLSNKSLDLLDNQSELNYEIGQKIRTQNNHSSLKQQNSSKACHSATLTRKNLTNNYTLTKQRSQMNPNHVVAELENLKQRKGLLENRMHLLENSRDELIDRLTQLDTVLKPGYFRDSRKQEHGTTPSKTTTTTTNLANNISQSQNNIAVPVATMQKITHSPPLIITTTSSSSTYIPVLSSSMAMRIPNTSNNQEFILKNPHNLEKSNQQTSKSNLRSLSQPATSGLQDSFCIEQEPIIKSIANNNISLLSLVNTKCFKNEELEFANKFNPNSNFNSSTSNLRNLRNDLFIAADSVTNAMQSLVNELNSDSDMYKMSNNCIDTKNYNKNKDLILNNNLEKFNLDNLDFNDNINFNNNRYITSHSLSASSTPITYRRNIDIHKLTNQMNHNSNIVEDDSKNDSKNINFNNFENGNIELNDNNIVISQFSNLNDSRLISMNLFNEKLLSNSGENKIENIDQDSLANLNVLENNNRIDNEEYNDEDDAIFQEYILSDNFIENLNANHEGVDQFINEQVLDVNSAIFPKSMHINLHEKQSCDLVSTEIEELNNQLIFSNNDHIAIWRKELEQRLLNDDKNLSNYLDEDKSKASINTNMLNTVCDNKDNNM